MLGRYAGRSGVISRSKNYYSNKTITLAFLKRAVELERQTQLLNQNLKSHERPTLPTKLHYLRNEEKDTDVYLLGCNHGGDSAGSLSPEVIELVKPEVTVIEENFFHFWEVRGKVFSYFKDLEVGKTFGDSYSFFSGWKKLRALKNNQTWLKKQKKPIRGREILNAIEAAEKVGSSIVFADVTDMTVRDRIANELETDERYKGRGIDPNMVCNCLAFGMGYEKNMLQLADKNFDVHKFGAESKAMLHGRDVAFIHHMRQCDAKKVVGVFGRLHLIGIVKYWENYRQRMAELGMTDEDLVDPSNINPLQTECMYLVNDATEELTHKNKEAANTRATPSTTTSTTDNRRRQIRTNLDLDDASQFDSHLLKLANKWIVPVFKKSAEPVKEEISA